MLVIAFLSLVEADGAHWLIESALNKIGYGKRVQMLQVRHSLGLHTIDIQGPFLPPRLRPPRHPPGRPQGNGGEPGRPHTRVLWRGGERLHDGFPQDDPKTGDGRDVERERGLAEAGQAQGSGDVDPRSGDVAQWLKTLHAACIR